MKLTELRIDYGELPVPGLSALYAFHQDFRGPLGFVWYQHVFKHHVDILYVFTHDYARRRGIASRLLAELREAYPADVMATGAANAMSEPWLRKNGFERLYGGWFLQPAYREVCPMI